MKIAVIGAMEEEVSILRDSLKFTKQEVLTGYEFTSGRYQDKEVVLLKSGIGKVNAAVSTTLLLDHYQPDFVINTGSAGGFHHTLNVGDVIISSDVRHHDVDVTVFNYEYGQVPGMPAAFAADDRLIMLAEKGAETLKPLQVVKGTIATGDSFMNDPERVNFIRSKFPDLYAVEMEAAAVAQVCCQFKTPFVVIRSLSDIAGKESEISFEQFLETAAANSTQLVKRMLEQL
ncbi:MULTISPECIES: 5'-methylthioadenosine/S-adenosylhomocysteine nucleosidase [Bacillus]|uniref:5'-methylthioadenosine/S-adenosylhomocysteine nucleosidase n=2 Tax=Bacillus TaxID=1386 RepID=A0A0M3R9P5_9BACI|nr:MULTISPECIES: 5'-methylthioadenosine/S-adenosylhomocysteine nucleosidase [Bacillus]ALC81786.1 5'-methylthioadenosine nucleosidase [Bacillus gobiensis]MBP1080888.1 adenosylhomocysteine nucleosidase [Bacillus capparidis]MED1097527.1 5'-methylthioadenosine/S-adenosylhomocysteine nucleosidase [Bacillus capparidis]